MKTNRLGRTGIEVTELCFGALPMGPAQKDMPVEESAKLVEAALLGGIKFIDTAQMYHTYAPIRLGIKRAGIRPVIATKSAAADYEGMQAAIEEARRELDIDVIDIMLLHAARAGTSVFEERAGALQCMLDYKEKGILRAVGISTHNVKVVERAAGMEELDVVFPILNLHGTGILEGTRADMEQAVQTAVDAGKGVYLMKALSGGLHINEFDDCMQYARNIPGIAAVALGMVSLREVEYNLKYFSDIPADELPDVQGWSKRYTVVQSLCIGCGRCVKGCPNLAMEMGKETHKAHILQDRCLTCGYCTTYCPQFAIRII